MYAWMDIWYTCMCVDRQMDASMDEWIHVSLDGFMTGGMVAGTKGQACAWMDSAIN